MVVQKTRGMRRGLILALCIIAVAALILCGTNLWMVASTVGDVYTLNTADGLHGDCILVLGCGLRSDGAPSHMLQDRLDVAITAYNMGIADRLLMSGDHGRVTYDEVNAMKDYAISCGVPSDKIFMDHAGFSTYESMVRAKEIFQCEKIVVVTQKYHLYRALYDAKSMGMSAQGISSSQRSYARQWYFDIREFAARTKDVAYCLLRPSPTYLGEAIPILSSSGDVTNDR